MKIRNRKLLAALVQLLLVFAVAVAWLPTASAQSELPDLTPVTQVPTKIWVEAQHAQGIIADVAPNGTVNVQVIFDPDCPFCAQLYTYMRKAYPDVAVRWVPVAYLTRDSSSRAGAILDSPDPAASLDTDFTQYDFDGLGSHGGYAIPKGKHYVLPAANAELQQAWAHTWGGATPTILVRNRNGAVTRVLGFQRDVIDQLLRQQRHTTLPAYHN